MVSSDEASLLSLPVDKFVRTVAERSPTPGGGSVAALSASLVGGRRGNGRGQVRGKSAWLIEGMGVKEVVAWLKG